MKRKIGADAVLLKARSDNTKSKTIELRRLDSLARLLEGNGICSAVCFDGEEILVSSNVLHKTSTDRSKAQTLITQVLDHFCKISKGEKVHLSKKINLFRDVAKQYISGNMQKAYNKNYNTYIDKLAEHVMKAKNANILKNKTVREIAGICGIKNLDAQTGMFLGAAIGSISRLGTDFKKLENSFDSNSPKLSTEIQQAFKKNKYKILHADEKKVHAEMRIVNKLLSKKPSGKLPANIYIGISKLCCLNCSLAIKAVNEAGLTEEKQSKKSKLSEVAIDMDVDGVPTQEQLIKVLVRGQHGLEFTWVEPEFMKNPKIKRRYDELVSEANLQKYSSSKAISMIASESESGKNTSGESTPVHSKTSQYYSDSMTIPDLLEIVKMKIQTGEINLPEIYKLLDVSGPSKDVDNYAQDIYVKDNAFNKFNDINYLYQQSDIQAIGQQLMQKHQDKTIFLGGLGGRNNAIDASQQLKHFKDKLEEIGSGVGIYNSGGNHWTAFKININSSQEPKIMRILYKDSYGNEASEAFKNIIAKAYPEYKVKFDSDKTRQQGYNNDGKSKNDGTNCGIFALANAQILASSKLENIEGYKFLDPTIVIEKYDTDILSKRKEYAVEYAQGTYENVQEVLSMGQKRQKLLQDFQPSVEKLASYLEKEIAKLKEYNIEIDAIGLNKSLSPEKSKMMRLLVVEGGTSAEEGKLNYLIRFSKALNSEEVDQIFNTLVSELGLNERDYNFDKKERILRIASENLVSKIETSVSKEKSEEIRIDPEIIRKNYIEALNIDNMAKGKEFYELAEKTMSKNHLDLTTELEVDAKVVEQIESKKDLSQVIMRSNSKIQFKPDNIDPLLDLIVKLKEEFKDIKMLNTNLYDFLVKDNKKMPIEVQHYASKIINNIITQLEERERVRDNESVRSRSNSGSQADAELSSNESDSKKDKDSSSELSDVEMRSQSDSSKSDKDSSKKVNRIRQALTKNTKTPASSLAKPHLVKEAKKTNKSAWR